MKEKEIKKTAYVTRTKMSGKYVHKLSEAGQMQERFSGTVPQRDERPAAEVLAETEARSTSSVFIP
jgi:hypothetical protein